MDEGYSFAFRRPPPGRVLRIALLLAVAMWVAAPAAAQDLSPDVASGRVCLACHGNEFPGAPQLPASNGEPDIWHGKHGVASDPRTPRANGGCVACHGDVTRHLSNPTDHALVPFSFDDQPAAEGNARCLGCHSGGNRMFWAGSKHDTNGTACYSCHQPHLGRSDPVRDKATQAEVCFGCHKDRRVDVRKPSHHPVLEGKVTCSDCHNPHGSAVGKNLAKDSVNETCYTCHAEKRGPFVHNHQPATEDCTICHNPHGTVIANMLKVRLPYLCHECHSLTGHPGQVAVLPTGPTTSASRLGTVARGCVNCHTNIHGSNSIESTTTRPGRFVR